MDLVPGHVAVAPPGSVRGRVLRSPTCRLGGQVTEWPQALAGEQLHDEQRDRLDSPILITKYMVFASHHD